VRCRPPRGRAWLRCSKVSPNEADFDLREMDPLSRNILHSREFIALADTRQRMGSKEFNSQEPPRLDIHRFQPKGFNRKPAYPVDIRNSAESGLGRTGNCHLHYIAESILLNVGGSGRDANVNSPRMSDQSVGGSIVVRGWESQPRGEGSQKFDTPLYSLAASPGNPGCTGGTSGCEREQDDNAESNLSSGMPNFREPCAVKVACTVRRGE